MDATAKSSKCCGPVPVWLSLAIEQGEKTTTLTSHRVSALIANIQNDNPDPTKVKQLRIVNKCALK